jgi:cytochrome c oxidase subunit 1
MLFSLGFVALFIIGGLSGVSHAIVPSDWQQTDTYYIVAHFHYVLFGGALMGLFSGAYYWWPKITGRFLDETLGKIHFTLMFVGMNMTFGPMHILGLQGMPRRIYVYPDGMGWNFWNMIESIGSAVLAVGIAVFIFNVLYTLKKKADAESDPWDARTLEWSIPSPPPAYNFAEIPQVHTRDDFWHRKYAETPDGRLVRIPAGGSREVEHAPANGHSIHMPSPSYWPMIAALGSPISAFGLIYPIEQLGFFFQYILVGVGAIVTAFGLYGWALEPATEPEPEHHEPAMVPVAQPEH